VSERVHRAPRTVLILALALATTSCTTLDRAVGKVPWFTTMRDQAAIRPFEGPGRNGAPYFLPPHGSVPVTGREDSLDLTTPAGRKIIDAKRNPVAATDSSLARGHAIYDEYCVVCHGPAGLGDGTVAGKMGYVPNLTMDLTKQRSDGYLYAILRHGRGIMPRYGDKIRDPRDRWNVVNYVRRLQGR
jgi:mono/diheme cytochrome c family protein